MRMATLLLLAACGRNTPTPDDTGDGSDDTDQPDDTDVVDTDGAPDPMCVLTARTVLTDTSVAAGDVGASLDALVGAAFDGGHDGTYTTTAGVEHPAELEVFPTGQAWVVILEPNGDNGAACPDVYEVEVAGRFTLEDLLGQDYTATATVFADGAFVVGGNVSWEDLQAAGDLFAPVGFEPADFDTVWLTWNVYGPVQGAWTGELQWSATAAGTGGVGTGAVEPGGALAFP